MPRMPRHKRAARHILTHDSGWFGLRTLLSGMPLSDESPTSEKKVPVNRNIPRHDILPIAFYSPYNYGNARTVASAVN